VVAIEDRKGSKQGKKLSMQSKIAMEKLWTSFDLLISSSPVFYTLDCISPIIGQAHFIFFSFI
jgi:hypothetical protein